MPATNMTTFRIIFILSIISFNCIGQDINSWKVRYFNNLNGSTWTSDNDINEENILTREGIGLTLLTTSIDSLKKNSTIWIFTDILTIKYHDTQIKKDNVILTCQYQNSEDLKQLKIILNDKKKSDVTFDYLPISNGGYVGLTKQKKKTKK